MAKLFDIFGNFTGTWPNLDISGQTGIGIPDVTSWLGKLNSGVELSNIRTGSDGERNTLEATVELNNGPTPAGTNYADGFPLVFKAMPDVEIKLMEGNEIKLFVAVSARGAEVIIENLKAEIILPGGLVEPPENYTGPEPMKRPMLPLGDEAEVTVLYRRSTGTSYITSLRIHVDEDLNVSLITPRPVSFEKCRFSGLSVNAIHDFVLIPSPSIAQRHQPWLRHSIVPFIEESEIQGMFAIRSLDIDPEGPPFKDLAKWLNGRSENEPQAEFVIDDLVVPFYSYYVLPIPRHITLGIRKLFERADQIKDVAEYFDFSRAPVVAYFSRSPVVALIVRSLFYKSMPADELDKNLGLTFSAGIAIGGDAPSGSTLDNPGSTGGAPGGGSPMETGTHLINFGLGEQYTIFAGYQLPEAFKLVELAGLGLYFLGFKLGYSIGRHIELSNTAGESAGSIFGKSIFATLDLMVTKDQDDGGDRMLSIRSVSSDKVKIIVEGIGYDRGNFTIGQKLSMPDGVAIWIAGMVAIVIEEIGILSEDGAGYFSFTGGVLWDTSSFDGGITFKRLRFRISGNPSAPPFKLDGFFIRLETSTVKIEAGGYYTEKTVDSWFLKELGLGGKLAFELSAKEYIIGMALIIGKASHPAEGSFDYFLIQIFFRGGIPIMMVELMSIQVLFTWNMQPKLAEVDRDARELRYYNWYKRSDPLRVPVSQLMANWKPQNHAWAFGAGASVSFAGCGSMLELALFVMGMDGPEEAGVLAALELFILGSVKPIGYAVLEIDTKNDRISFMMGVDIKVSNFVEDAPAWLDSVVTISGNLFASNDPGTVAVGRLSDERTWFGIELKYDVWIAMTNFRFALCFEWIDGVIIGFGIVFRMEGGATAGVIAFRFNVGFGVLVAWFKTGSADYAAAVFIEGGLRIILFGFIRFGINARLDFSLVGNDPSRTELRGKFTFETPWFLPDVTWTIEEVWGTQSIEDLGSSSSPLRRSTNSDSGKQTYALHKEGVDQGWNGDGVAPLHSVKELRNHSTTEADRLARFAANNGVIPIPTDVTVEIEFSVAVNDKVLADPASSTQFGTQESKDLTLEYEFIGIAIRRRPRFGGGTWTSVDEMKELGPDFSDSNGVLLEGSFDPSNISMIWDPKVKIEGKSAPKRLLINAKTPFEFNTKDPEADEENIKNNPNWPCCPRDKEKYPRFKFHQLTFRDNLPGSDIIAPEPFSNSNSFFSFYPFAFVRPPKLGTALPAGSPIAHVPSLKAGIVGRAVFDEDVAYILIRMAWFTSIGRLRFVLYDRLGNHTKEHVLSPSSNDFESITLGAPFPIRSVEIQFISPKDGISTGPEVTGLKMMLRNNLLELDTIIYVSVDEFIDHQRETGNCGASGSSHNPYEGKGKVSFLPNTEYEVKITTRVSIKHPSEEPDPAEIEEYVYFKTKGLPGMNAVNRVGEELEPYISKAYQGGMGLVYREEPVAISFTDDFYVAVPLTLRPSGTTAEHTILMEMQLLVREDSAQSLTALNTATGEDWIVENRSSFIEIISIGWLPLQTASFSKGTRMISQDPSAIRLAGITRRPDVYCGTANPLDVTGTVLIAPPQGTKDPDDATRELWPAQTAFTATVRQKEAPLIARESFIGQDLTAFDIFNDSTAISNGSWSVTEGVVHANTEERQFACFGENTWNHVEISVALTVKSGMGGIALSLPAGSPGRALFVILRRSGPGVQLRFYERSSGSGFSLRESADLDPALSDPAGGPMVLRVWAFDDILRASVGETRISLQRNAYREGRLALVADGEIDFFNLLLHGLDMYQFPFISSRFISFNDHIGSFSGELDTLDGSEMGASTPANVSSLYSGSRTLIQEVMQPGVEDLKRQSVFDSWQQALALPLKDELTRLEVSRFRSGSQTAFFYLESPEPLDFSTEVGVTLSKRVKVDTGGWTLPEVIPGLISNIPLMKAQLKPYISGSPLIPPSGAERRKRASRDLLFRGDAIHNLENGINPALAVANVQDTQEIHISDEDLGSDENHLSVRLKLHKELSSRDAGDLIFMKHVSEGNELSNVRFFKLAGGNDLTSGEYDTQLNRTDVTLAGRTLETVREILKYSKPGGIFTIDTQKGLLDVHWPIYTYKELDAVVLQDGSRTRALIIPVDGSNHKMLDTGRYALHFAIYRRRWTTTDTPDTWNTYSQECTIKVELT